jgi:hypothetical protein
MPTQSQLAVEITKNADSLDIWVDANNNGARDDDDVNIYVTAGGGFYTTSPTFKQALDTVIQSSIKELAVALLNNSANFNNAPAEAKLRELALELVVKATAATEIQAN